MLGSTSENYLTLALTSLTKILAISESFAGVTLLAFANGAPDVITSFTAGFLLIIKLLFKIGGIEVEGIKLAIGSNFGACLFSTTLVLYLIIIQS